MARPLFPTSLPLRCGAAGLLAALILAGCATPPGPAPVEEEGVGAPAVTPSGVLINGPLKHLSKRKLAPMPVRPLNVQTRCAFRDDNGYGGRIQLLVKEAQVQQFSADVEIPNQGSCHFDLKDFRQTGTLPQIALAANAGDCAVHMWEQGPRVTVAFANCRAQCSGDAVDYLWPIQVDPRKHDCF